MKCNESAVRLGTIVRAYRGRQQVTVRLIGEGTEEEDAEGHLEHGGNLPRPPFCGGAFGVLSSAGVPCQITSDEHLPGLGSFFSIVVPSDLLHRARGILEGARVSERELTFLATGELPEDSNGK